MIKNPLSKARPAPAGMPAKLAAAVVAAMLAAAPAFAALPLAGDAPSLAPMLEKAIPAVVTVETQTTVRLPAQRWPNDPFFRRFFGAPEQPPHRERRRSGVGSGVVIDAAKGHIVTNHHVIAGADSIVATLGDGRRYAAEVIGADPDTDLAILKIDADDLTALPFGDSSRLRVGDFVFAIGNPLGLDHTVTSGIVSALGRSGLGIESYEDFIQTDASINRGNSGGALIDIRGRLVGINTAIYHSGAGGSIGIGFAIPINMVAGISEQLLEFGEVRRGRLGVVIQTLTPELAEAFGVEQTRGIIIAQIEPGSPAEEAGLMPGDIVLSINERPVKNWADMRNHIGLLPVGAEVELEVLRDARKRTLTAVIERREVTTFPGARVSKKLAGALFQVRERDGEQAVAVQKVAARSPAYLNGLRENDVLLAVNRRRVSSFEEVRDAVASGGRGTILVAVERRGRRLFLAIR